MKGISEGLCSPPGEVIRGTEGCQVNVLLCASYFLMVLGPAYLLLYQCILSSINIPWLEFCKST